MKIFYILLSCLYTSTLLAQEPIITESHSINTNNYYSLNISLYNEPGNNSGKDIICKSIRVYAPISRVSECGFSTVSSSPFSLLQSGEILTLSSGETKVFETAGLSNMFFIQSQYFRQYPLGEPIRYCSIDNIVSECSYPCKGSDGTTYSEGNRWWENLYYEGKKSGQVRYLCKSDGTSEVASVSCNNSSYQPDGNSCVPRDCPGNHPHNTTWDDNAFYGKLTLRCRFGTPENDKLECNVHPTKRFKRKSNPWLCVAKCAGGLFEDDLKTVRNAADNGSYKQSCYQDTSFSDVSGSLVCDNGYEKVAPRNHLNFKCKPKNCEYQNGTIQHGKFKKRYLICQRGLQEVIKYSCNLGVVTESYSQRACHNGPVTD